MKPRLVFIVGPTAVGKTAVSIILAKKLNAEIISCDSMQVYRGMDIISSKPALADRKKIPHHLLSVVSPQKEHDVSMFRKAALRKIKEILKKRKTPLLVGGTGLYISVLIDGIFETKINDQAVRKKFYSLAKAKGSRYLHARLVKVDPVAAAKIHPNDTKRLARALEVFKSTGKPISELQIKRRGLDDEYEVRIFCLNLERKTLYRRIDCRVDKMFSQGLENEVKRLLGHKLSRTASFAIGIRELKGYFEGGYDLGRARDLIQRNTRHYAKRQLTWFRKDKRIEWLAITGKETAATIASRLWKKLS